MKTALRKAMSLLLAVMMVFGTAAVGLTNVAYAEEECEPESSKAVWEDEEVPTLNPGNPDYNSTNDVKCELVGRDVYMTERYDRLLGDNIEGDYGYDVIDGKAVIVDSSAKGDVNVPSSLGGYEVTAIGNLAFARCESYLKNITIPDGIVSIGGLAFYGCVELESVTIPDSVTSIEGSAFRCCHRLKKINIPRNVAEIGNNPFIDCDSLTEITVAPENKYYSSDESGVLYNKSKTELISYPAGSEITSYKISDGVTSIHSAAFISADNLVSVTVPDGITSIPNDLFNGCSSLFNINIPDGVTQIGAYGFEGCSSLISITIPDSISSIGDYAFCGCNSLTSVTIPDSLTSIGEGIFERCTGLTTVTVGKSVTIIGCAAFRECGSLKSITISDNVTSIVGYAFYGCESLTDVYFNGTEAQWKVISIGSYNENLTDATIHYGIHNVNWIVDGKQTTQEVKVGAEITPPADPAKSGYIFKGWNPAVPETMPEKDMTFTAVFEKAVYNVTWVVDGAKTTHKYEFGAKITPPANPTKSGYIFKGWSPAVPATMPANDMTFTAVLEKDIYNLGEETYGFENFGDYHSSGHCFAMSVTSSGYYLGELDIESVTTQSGQNLNDLTLTAEVKEPICYYQPIQGDVRDASTVAGGSYYLTRRNNIDSDWNEVVNYVKNHEYDGKGTLQIGFRGKQKDKYGNVLSGGHAINFLRYEEVNGQPRIYAYDNNFPDTETYFYKDSSGNIKQAPEETFNVSITCIALRSIPMYFDLVGGFVLTDYIYAPADTISVSGATEYLMEGTVDGEEYAMYKVPENAEKVIIVPLVDNAEFTYAEETYSMGNVDDETVGIFTLASDDENGVQDVGLEMVTVGLAIRTPSTTEITYGDSIILHADVANLPEGAKIVWSADNDNFTYTASADGTTCTVSPSSSGDTTFTAAVVDSNGAEIGSDTQTMTSKAGFFQKLIAFFKNLFGLTKIITDVFKF